MWSSLSGQTGHKGQQVNLKAVTLNMMSCYKWMRRSPVIHVTIILMLNNKKLVHWSFSQDCKITTSFYIYIYAFIRRFYPKRLTVHSGYTFIVSMCVSWESNPQPLRCWRNAPPLSHRNTELLVVLPETVLTFIFTDCGQKSAEFIYIAVVL